MKRHPIFARFYEWMGPKMLPVEDPLRREMLEGLRGRILEVGAGTGLNFSLYEEGAEVIAAEPEPNMARLALPRAADAPVPVTLVRGAAEALPFDDRSFDAVVLSLVMCSVEDPRVAAAEAHRVLRPGGEVRVFEHVRSLNPRHARWQRWMTVPWRQLSAGCHLDRDTAATLRSAGFEVDVRRVPVGPPSPARPHIVGRARPR